MKLFIFILIWLSNCLITANATAGSYTRYTTHFYSLDNLPGQYLTYRDQWTANISPAAYLAENSATPVDILRELSAHKLPEVRMAVARNPKTPTDILERYFAEDNIDLKIAVLENPKGAKYQDAIFQGMSHSVALKMAEAQRLPPDIIRKIFELYSNRPSRDTRNPLYDPQVYSRWAELINVIAGNPNTPLDVLARMSKDITNGYFYAHFCENPKVIEEFLHYAEDGDINGWLKTYSSNDTHMLSCVLAAEARQKSFNTKQYSIPLKSALAVYGIDKSGKYNIRFLAENKDIPADLMQEFLENIKGGSYKNIGGRTVYKKRSGFVEYPLLKNPALPKQEIDELCTSKKTELLEWLAQNPSITNNCVNILAGDIIKSGKIRDDEPFSRIEILCSLASNPVAPKALISILLDAKFLLPVALAAISRPDIDLSDISDYILKDSQNFILKDYNGDPEPDQSLYIRRMENFFKYKAALERRYKNLQDPEQKKVLLEYAGESKSQFLRAFVAGCPDTPLELLKQLSRDSSLLVRLELAKNPHIDKTIAETLSNDKELIAIDSKKSGYE